MKGGSQRIWYVIVAILLIPAFFLNLGVVPFIEDESIRALVALEMMLKGDYLVPTLNDSLYFAKPPLYNWILVGAYNLFGTVNEWSSRVPTVVFTFLMAALIYRTSRSYFTAHHTAVLAGLMWLTCGRVLFYDSFLGLIDIAYSAVVYALFVAVWYLGYRQRWTRLYVVAYALAGISYLLKGMPIIVFLPCTLVAFAIVQRSWRWLLKPSHLLGILVGVIIVGGYYYLYAQVAPVSRSLGGLSRQASMRTPLSHDLGGVLSHVVSYPFEYLYHYLPWTLFLVLLIRRDTLEQLRKHPFFLYVAIVFGANILVYWISPGTYARYVLMLVPLTYLLGLFFYERTDRHAWQMKALRWLILSIVVLLPILALGAMWHPDLLAIPNSRLLVGGTALILFVFAGSYIYQRDHRPIILVAVLLTLRIGLNAVVLPSRAAATYGAVAKTDAQRVGQRYKGQDLRLYKNSKLDYTSSFYLSSTRGEVTKRDFEAIDRQAIYLVDTARYDIPEGVMLIDSIKKREARQTLYLMQY